ncbi:hypothetical protein V6N13_092967 [Hibiscus sabdariffa]|uniref:Uncharacterized protein n=1 Tax=Hibiscus sabdariffa TaxID=183260 RepID=A0ABR2NQL2_9ROSI
MEAALCLGHGPMLSISHRMPPGMITTLRFGFNHSFVSVSKGSMTNHRRCHRFCSQGPLALDRSNSSMPSNEKGGAKAVRGAVGASLALACTLGIITCGCKMNIKAMAGPKQQVYQKSPSLPRNVPPMPPRKVALKSLLDVTVDLASKDGRSARGVSSGSGSHFPGWQSAPSKYQVDQLKKVAVSLMKRGQPEDALHMLNEQYMKYKSEPESAYEISLALVEILITQGKYEEAYEFMKTQEKMSDFDVRPTLYKAIVCTMLDKDEAQDLWDEFAGSIGGFSPPN